MDNTLIIQNGTILLQTESRQIVGEVKVIAYFKRVEAIAIRSHFRYANNNLHNTLNN